MRKIWALLCVLLLATISDAELRHRLESIVAPDGVNVAVDRFIIGTEDKYIATIVRSVPDAFDETDFAMNDALLQYDKDDLSLIERMVFDKNAKRIALLERSLVLGEDLITAIVVDSGINSDFAEAQPGSIEELIWEGVAGPDGWGTRLLSDDPRPVLLSGDRIPIDTKRYIPAVINAIGGVFLDKESIKRTENGCIALFIESFNPDAEMYYGGMVMQYASQPYKGALYAATGSEFDFSRKAVRQMRYTIFGLDYAIIYSVKIANPLWDDGSMNPMNLFVVELLTTNLPEDLYSAMPADINAYREYARTRFEEMMEVVPEKEPEPES